jgi:heat-inducible transcriptional repressor
MNGTPHTGDGSIGPRDRKTGANEPVLQSRDREILRAIIDSFLQTGEPVGSRTVSRSSSEALSPATIRNVMSDLEQSGLLAQPHPSAGRVPTERGLRFYVDELLSAGPVPDEENARIVQALGSRRGELGALLEQASFLLAELSHNVGMVLVPDFAQRVFERIVFVRVSATRVLTLLVSRPGMIHQRVVDVDQDYTQDELDRISRYLSESFDGLALTQIRVKVLELMKEEKALYDRLIREALELSARSFEKEEGGGDLIVEGAANILEVRDFGDVERMKTLFHAFEEKSRLVALLNRCMEQKGHSILIGSEAGTPEMEGCALIASPYCDGATPVGTIGILGPSRMAYGRVIAVVDVLAKVLSAVLTQANAPPDGGARRSAR